MTDSRKAYLSIITSMVIFGTVGIFVRGIDMPSAFIALARGVIGSALIALFVLVRNKKIDRASILANAKYLVFTGICIGINWVFLFESYRYTTVAIATVCYYMQPVFVILLNPLFIKEKINKRNIFCIFTALLGISLVCGIWNNRISFNDTKGIVFGLIAAFIYALVLIGNKKIHNMDSLILTGGQLLLAALSMLPYVLLKVSHEEIGRDLKSIGLLIIVSILHTGVAYILFFGAIAKLKVHTAAVLTFIDPVIAIICSAVFLKENLGILGVLGAGLVLVSAYISEKK